MSRPIGWTKPKVKPCRICGNPVTPTRRKDRNAFWYPRQCEVCKGKAKDNALRIQRLAKAMSGRGNPRYRPIGSKRIEEHSDIPYWMIKVSDPNNWMYEHRFIMEQILGRKLKQYELVHHKDNNSLNNEPFNLQITSTIPHLKYHRTISK